MSSLSAPLPTRGSCTWTTTRSYSRTLARYVALFDGLDDITKEMSEAQEGYDDTGAVPYKLRSREQVAPFFDGLEFVQPGLVRCTRWRPDTSRFGTGPEVPSLAAVARKP